MALVETLFLLELLSWLIVLPYFLISLTILALPSLMADSITYRAR